MHNIKRLLPVTLASIAFAIIISMVSNMVGYGFSFMESIPGMLILGGLALGGYLLSWIVPIKQMSTVLWISILAILIASPISPIADYVIAQVDKVSFMSVVTPILAYAGVVVGKDWASFKNVGVKGLVVALFVVAGTFLISSMLGDLFMKIF